MNQKKLIIGTLILVVIVGVGLLIFGKHTTPRTAMFSGWLFEVKTPSEIQKYLIIDNGEQIAILTEKEILKAVRSDKWIEPTIKYTPEQWAVRCKEQQSLAQKCSYDEFQLQLPCHQNPNQKWCRQGSFENWRRECEHINEGLTSCILVPYEKYKTLMENYLHDHGVNGSIINAYVALIPIVGLE